MLWYQWLDIGAEPPFAAECARIEVVVDMGARTPRLLTEYTTPLTLNGRNRKCHLRLTS